jgi:hypothetical protein
VSRRIMHGAVEYGSMSAAAAALGVSLVVIRYNVQKANAGKAAYLFGQPIREVHDDQQKLASWRRPGPLLKNLCLHRLGAYHN